MDWVVFGQAYGLDSVPYILDPTGGTGTDPGDTILIPLTAHSDIDDLPASRIPQVEQTAIRVKGSLHYWWTSFDPDNPPSGTALWGVHFRIAKTVQGIGTVSPLLELPADYDMRLPETANDDFLWEYVSMQPYRSSYWGSTTGQYGWATPQRVDVDITVKRRLKQRDVLVLYINSWLRPLISSGPVQEYQDPVDMRLLVEPVFRTLVQMNT